MQDVRIITVSAADIPAAQEMLQSAIVKECGAEPWRLVSIHYMPSMAPATGSGIVNPHQMGLNFQMQVIATASLQYNRGEELLAMLFDMEQELGSLAVYVKSNIYSWMRTWMESKDYPEPINE